MRISTRDVLLPCFQQVVTITGMPSPRHSYASLSEAPLVDPFDLSDACAACSSSPSVAQRSHKFLYFDKHHLGVVLRSWAVGSQEWPKTSYAGRPKQACYAEFEQQWQCWALAHPRHRPDQTPRPWTKTLHIPSASRQQASIIREHLTHHHQSAMHETLVVPSFNFDDQYNPLP